MVKRWDKCINVGGGYVEKCFTNITCLRFISICDLFTESPSYIPSFIKIGSGIQVLMGEGDTQTHRQQGDVMSLHLFFDVNTSLSSVPDTLHVQKLERHEIGTNLFRKNFHDVFV
jgi:hypothetical protein